MDYDIVAYRHRVHSDAAYLDSISAAISDVTQKDLPDFRRRPPLHAKQHQ